MNIWYSRQFGDRAAFACVVSLGNDPQPVGDPAIDASWGGISIWVKGRCLTRAFDGESLTEEVRWNLLEVLRWVYSAAVFVVNEEPLPLATNQRAVDACDWLDVTEEAGAGFRDESVWFSKRSEWMGRHVLRSADLSVALPHVALRRLGTAVEVSWDNENWASSHPSLRFVESRGREAVPAATVAGVLCDMLATVTAELAGRFGEVKAFVDLAHLAKKVEAEDSDWKLLIHSETAKVVSEELPELAARLSERVREARQGIYVPHTFETMVLRQACLDSADDVRRILDGISVFSDEAASTLLWGLVKPTPAPTKRPWTGGYDRAVELREVLGWGEMPVSEELPRWMAQQKILFYGVDQLHPGIDLVTRRAKDAVVRCMLNFQTKPNRREVGLAAALGHVLMDEEDVAVDGMWEYWPAAARARAFAAMLLIPEDALRTLVQGLGDWDASKMHAVMTHFGTGPYLTSYHLKNLGYITEEERIRLLANAALQDQARV